MRRRIFRARGDFCEKVSNFIFWISLLPTFLLRHSPYLKPPVCAQICDCKFVLTKIKRNFPKMSSSPRNISLLDLVCKESLPAILVQLKLRIFSAFLTCAYILNTHTQNAGKMYGWGSDNLRSSKSLFENQRSSFVGALWFIFTKNFWNNASLRYLDVLVHNTDKFVLIFLKRRKKEEVGIGASWLHTDTFIRQSPWEGSSSQSSLSSLLQSHCSYSDTSFLSTCCNIVIVEILQPFPSL